MEKPINEVARNNTGAMTILNDHPDLTELCRSKNIVGALVWVVFKDMANEDAQEMKKLLFLSADEFKKHVRKNKKVNKEFLAVDHPYGEKKTKGDNDEEHTEEH